MDSRGFERMVHQYQDMVYAVAYAYCRDRVAAEDVAQEAFLKAFRSADGLREPPRMKTWLYSIARFTAIDWVRKNRREKVGPVPERAEAPPPPEDRAGRILSILHRLKDDYREIMMLRYVKGLSYAEIARLTGATVTAVGEKLHRVRDLVRERLKTEVPS